MADNLRSFSTPESLRHHVYACQLYNREYEWLDEKKSRQFIETIREKRNGDPKEAILALIEILKRIRNRRAHGFKTPDGSRDVEILGNSAALLRLMVISAAEELTKILSPAAS